MNRTTSSEATATGESADTSHAPSRAWNITLWILQLGAAIMLGMAGFSKLTGAEQMVGLFESIGVGQWFRYVTGLLEITGAVLLLIPTLAGVGALLLACVMLGAVATHLFVIGGSPLTPLVLLAVLLVIAWGRRRRTLRLVGP
jgi:uncharacterized membrane protein YphA (DoxX/SURF4 family)